MKLTTILAEIKIVPGGRPKVIDQSSNRKELMLISFPDGEKERFFFGGYYSMPYNIFSIHSSDQQEIDEYVHIFQKYNLPYKLSDSGNEFSFLANIVDFADNIIKYSPDEQERINVGIYKNKNIDLNEIKMSRTWNLDEPGIDPSQITNGDILIFTFNSYNSSSQVLKQVVTGSHWGIPRIMVTDLDKDGNKTSMNDYWDFSDLINYHKKVKK